MLESRFQRDLVRDVRNKFPGCCVIKNDPTNNQGFPDLIVLYEDKWAALECKKSATAKHRPNQDYFIDKLNRMSFAKFIYPENKKEVLNDLAGLFKIPRGTRLSKSK